MEPPSLYVLTMNPEKPFQTDPNPEGALALIESRIARIEEHLGLDWGGEVEPTLSLRPAPAVSASPGESNQDGEDFEYEVGQKWFAKVGIFTLAIGVAYTLSLPYAHLAPYLPSLLGCLLAGALFLAARILAGPCGFIFSGRCRR